MHLEVPLESVRDRFLIARAFPVFAGLDDESLMVVAEYTRPRFFPAGSLLLEEGGRRDMAYMVYDGTVRVEHGRTVNRIVAPGGIGFLSVLSGTPMRRSIAETPTWCLELPADVIFDTMETNFAYLRNSLRVSATGLLELRSSLPADPDEHRAVGIGTWRDDEPTLVEKMLEVKAGALFGTANIDAIIDVARLSKEVRYEPGDVIWEIGAPPTFSVRIDYGIVRCTSPQGRHVEVGADFALGSMDTLSDQPRAYEARAQTKVIAVRLGRDDLLGVFENHPTVGIDLSRILSGAVLLELDKKNQTSR